MSGKGNGTGKAAEAKGKLADSKGKTVENKGKTAESKVKEPEAKTKAVEARERKKSARPGTKAGKQQQFDLADSRWYLNRELTWLAFCRRVLEEGKRPDTPLLARVMFVAIIGSNLDEFFMKRIGGLKQQVGAGVKKLSVDGRTPQQQITECNAMVRDLLDEQCELSQELIALLAEEDIHILTYKQLTPAQRREADRYFHANIYPLLTPQGMDPAHPFPFISNLALNLLVTTRLTEDGHPMLNRIKVPLGVGVPRFIPIGGKHRFILFEDLIANNLDVVFPGMIIDACETFRVTRNAITEQNADQANDLLETIESALRDRKFAEIVRLEISPDMDDMHRGMLAAELGIDENKDVFAYGGIMAKRDMMELVGIDRPELHYPVHQPLDHPKLLDTPNIFHVIREEGSILLQHPYESFDATVERFLGEASQDPKVLAIKMTLYRTSSDSRIIQYLVDAAHNGKQVAVVVELKARFDEQANIRWAEYLEQQGIHVTYGVVGLKTHSKVIFVVRRDYSGLRRYAHIGTGNYHAGTARLYSDLGLLTCDPAIGEDLTELFNYLTTGYAPVRNYKKLLPSPRILKKALLAKIRREMECHTDKNPGHIQLKTNALEDRDVTEALYRASQAGVKVDLLVRDTCRLRPGIPGLSDNIRVVSIVGRFLEHTRIYYFRNSGKEEYFIGSADIMMRNLEKRVEVVTPVEKAELRERLREILDIQLDPAHGGWIMQPDGTYRRPDEWQGGPGPQEKLIELAKKRLADHIKIMRKKGGAKKVAKRKKK